jgi:hypothetical protein
MAAKFFTGLPLDGPDPECVRGHGEAALAVVQHGSTASPPRPAVDHSHRRVPVTIGRRPPERACEEGESMPSQQEKALRFRALHEAPGAGLGGARAFQTG